MSPQWSDDEETPRGAAYDERFERLARSGVDVHGEAHLVEALVRSHRPARGRPTVLDAGCGTGRVAGELARRGMDVCGVDLDRSMLAVARQKWPDLTWVEADLATFDLDRSFDVAVLAGNVLIFVAEGTEARVVARVAAHLAPGGLLVCGFGVRPGGYGPAGLDRDAAAAGLRTIARWATWDREPWPGDGTYQVSLHQAVGER